MNNYIKDNLNKHLTKIKCPVNSCQEILRDKLIRKVLSDIDIEKYEDMCIGKINCTHTCLLKECGRKIIYTDINTQYDCYNCSLYNCIKCKMPHYFNNCETFMTMTRERQHNLCQDQLIRAHKILLAKKKKIVQESIESNNKIDLWPSKEIFSCQMCGVDIAKYDGVCLRSCLDLICRTCLTSHVKSSDQIPIMCPVCSKREICDREIKALLNDSNSLKIYRNKCLNFAKAKNKRLIRCYGVNCTGIFYVKRSVTSVKCDKCFIINCIACRTLHNDNETCDQYQKLHQETNMYKSIEQQIKKKELMRCPDCKTLIQKTHGCGWIQCTTCGTELCWYLQTYRWGPNGCKCGENGKWCYNNCGGCIADVGRMLSTINSPSNNGGTGFSANRRPNRRLIQATRSFNLGI